MERYNHPSDFDNFRTMMSKKSTRQLEAELKERIAQEEAQQKIDFDDVDPNHLVHEHIDPPTFEQSQGEKQ